jgi:hypothetical protein
MKAKGLDPGDKVMATSIAFRLVMALRKQSKRYGVVDRGKQRGVILWELPPEKTLV